MAAKCASCGVNDANGGDGLCGSCRESTDRLIADAKTSAGERRQAMPAQSHHIPDIDELRATWQRLHSCPTCAAPQPRLHPRNALGQIKLCPDPFHRAAAPANMPSFTPKAALQPIAEQATATTPAAPAATDNNPEDHPMPLLSTVRNDLKEGLDRLGALLPKIENAITNPKIDELVDAALEAAGFGVGAETFDAITGMLRAAAANKAQAQQQDTGQTTPAADPSAPAMPTPTPAS